MNRRGWFRGFAGGIASALMAVFLRRERPDPYIRYHHKDDGTIDAWRVDPTKEGWPVVPGTYRKDIERRIVS